MAYDYNTGRNEDANGIVGPTFDPQPVESPDEQRRKRITDLYRQHLGRDPGQEGFDSWMGNDDFEAGIAGSPEARARAAGGGGGGSTASQWNEDAFWKGWTGRTVDDLTNYIRQGGYGQHVTQFGSKNDKLRFADGREYDAVYAAGDRGGQGAQRLQIGGPGFNANAGSGGAGGASQRWNDLYAQVMARANQNPNATRDDPSVRPQADAYAANEQRQRRDYLADAAESSSPYGTGAQQGRERMTAEGVGQRTGANEAALMGEVTARRAAEVERALGMAVQMGSQEQQQALQRELAYLQNELQRYSLSQNQNQFMSELGLRTEQQNNYWDALRRGLL